MSNFICEELVRGRFTGARWRKHNYIRNVDVCKLCEVSVATTIEFWLWKLLKPSGDRGILRARILKILSLPERKWAAGQTVIPQRQWAVLGALSGAKGLYKMSYAGEVFERNRQVRSPEVDGRLFQVCRSAASV